MFFPQNMIVEENAPKVAFKSTMLCWILINGNSFFLGCSKKNNKCHDLVMFVYVLANKAWQFANYCPVKRSKVEELIICIFHRLANKTREGFYWQFHFTVFSFVGQYRCWQWATIWPLFFTPLGGRKWRRTKKPLDESERGEWKSWLKAQHSENEDHGIRSHHFMGNRLGNSGSSGWLLSFWAPKTLQMVIAAMKLKDAHFLEGHLWPT